MLTAANKSVDPEVLSGTVEIHERIPSCRYRCLRPGLQGSVAAVLGPVLALTNVDDVTVDLETDGLLARQFPAALTRAPVVPIAATVVVPIRAPTIGAISSLRLGIVAVRPRVLIHPRAHRYGSKVRLASQLRLHGTPLFGCDRGVSMAERLLAPRSGVGRRSACGVTKSGDAIYQAQVQVYALGIPNNLRHRDAGLFVSAEKQC